MAAPRVVDPAKPTLAERVRRRVRKLRAKRDRQQPATDALLPRSPFADWDQEKAAAAVDDAIANQTIDTSSQAGTDITPAPGEARFSAPRSRQNPIAINRAFFQGDHWQGGAGYIGPHPAPTDEGFADTMNEIGLIFTSQNAVKEVVTRHALGCVGKPTRWSLVPRRETGDQKPTADEQTLIDEATGFVRNWLKARKVPTLLRDAVSTLLLAERSAITVTVPAGLTTENAAGETVVNVPQGDVKAALAKIWPEHPKPDAAVVVIDDDTKLEAGIAIFEADENGDDNPEEFAWLCFLDETAQTVMRIIGADEDPTSTENPPRQSKLNLGGRITMFEMHRAALSTPQVQQQQRGLNFAMTMVPRNVTTGGFLERIILDAQMPGHWELDASGKKTGKWIPNKFYVGAGTTNFLEGAEYDTTDNQGNRIITRGSPSAVFREPVKPDASLTAKGAHYEAILAEVGQLHVLISADSTASAVARIQARVEYLNTLLLTQPEVEAAYAWLIETALAMAEAIAGVPGKYTGMLRADVALRLDTGPITPEERAAIEASIGKTISQETAMLLLGVDDVDAEKTRMAADRLARATLAKAVGEAMGALTLAGATLEGAAKYIGLEDDELEDLMTPAAEPAPSADTGDTATGRKPPVAAEKNAPADKGAKQGSTSGSAVGGE